MTLDEMKRSEKIFVTAADVAQLLESDPHTIRCSAKEQPELIGFPFTFVGNRMKIPRMAFLAWLGETGGK